MTTPPPWLQSLADQVTLQMKAVEHLAPLGCHVFRSPEQWEVTIFASATEIIGGPKDGRHKPSRFFLDVQGLIALFDRVDCVAWQAQGLGPDDDVGPHLSLEGIYQGEPVWLRIPSLAPRGFPTGRQAYVHQQTWEESW